MGSPLRSRLQLDERRAQLLELGLELFGTRPYDDISIDDIAAAAGVSKGLLYHYFGSKREFYLETVRHASKGLLAALEPDDDLPLPLRALTGLSAYLAFVEEHAAAYAALMTGGLGADPEIDAVVEQTRLAIIGRMMLDLGLREPRPVFRLALRSYLGAVEAASLEWLLRKDVPRSTLLQMLTLMMRCTVDSAAMLDPQAELDPAITADDPAELVVLLGGVAGRG